MHYIGAVLPQAISTINTIAITDLRNPEVLKQFNTVSTLYVPPREISPINSTMSEALGRPRLPLAILGTSPDSRCTNAYGPIENATIAKLDSHIIPDDHIELRASAAIKKFMIDLALKPRLFSTYKEDPASIVEAVEGLTAKDKFALQFGKDGPIYTLMQATRSDIAQGREVTEDEIARGAGPIAFLTVLLIATIIINI